MGNNIEALLKPQSVVVVGASAQAGKIGNVILQQVVKGKFRVYAVNPKGGEACGLPLFASLSDLPEVPDLAVIALPALLRRRAVGPEGGLDSACARLQPPCAAGQWSNGCQTHPPWPPHPTTTAT